MKQCRKCAAPLSDGYRICPSCGGRDFSLATPSGGAGGERGGNGAESPRPVPFKQLKQATLLPRWAIASIIVGVMAFAGLLYASTGWLANAATQATPEEVETENLATLLHGAEGQQLLAAALPKDHAYSRLVNRIGHDLLKARQDPAGYRYQFLVVPKKDVNALAVPGGLIVVYTGLFEILDSPEELGAVLAHEIQHVEHRHGLRQTYKRVGTLALIRMLFGAAQDSGTLVTANLLTLKYSRDSETEADVDGARLLASAGVSPKAMVLMLEKLGETESGWTPTILSGHPQSSARARLVAAMPETKAPLPKRNSNWNYFWR